MTATAWGDEMIRYEVHPDPVEGGRWAVRLVFRYGPEPDEVGRRWVAREMNRDDALVCAIALGRRDVIPTEIGTVKGQA